MVWARARPDHVIADWIHPGEARSKRGERIVGCYLYAVRGCVHDPAFGDPESGVAPGAACFKDFPVDWVCLPSGASRASLEDNRIANLQGGKPHAFLFQCR
ncbi:MAG: rubredoxin [Syntrophobacteraceae bacterium]|nr:rubredoxin [Syntrophobacteraceae bacterium]